MKVFVIYSIDNEGIDEQDVVTLDELKEFDTPALEALKPYIESIEGMIIDQENRYSGDGFEYIETG